MISTALTKNDSPPAKYFPVNEQPLTMKAGLFEFGTDFGNLARDSLYFQRDRQAPLYYKVKKEVEPERHWTLCEQEQHISLHAKSVAWIIERQKLELGITPDPNHIRISNDLFKGEFELKELAAVYNTLSLNVQEDIVLMAERPDSSLIMGNISMPSFWDPKHIKGANFTAIHSPVPQFPKNVRMSQRLGNLMATKGPFVRFVWTVANDDRLDHHPDKGRTAWESGQQLWLRLERQVTVPFNGLGALFLIRTYLYKLDDLSRCECKTLKLAINCMPEEIAHYKGLWNGKDVIQEALLKLI